MKGGIISFESSKLVSDVTPRSWANVASLKKLVRITRFPVSIIFVFFVSTNFVKSFHRLIFLLKFKCSQYHKWPSLLSRLQEKPNN